ncbi:MAG TPA: N-acetyltransferase [Bacteroidetes bacterium]|nr:N-acetyltransferase [Bacteroidota bacterium]
MKTFPELNTSRLLLRKITLADVPALLKYVNHKSITDNILNFPAPYLEEDAVFRLNFVHQGFKNAERYVFAIILKEGGELIGEIGLHLDGAHNRAEMGFWLAVPFWNMGLMTEAVKVVLEFGFEALKLHKIHATHYLDNPASAKVLQHCGMLKEAELKDHYRNGDTYLSVIQYRLTREEFGAALS